MDKPPFYKEQSNHAAMFLFSHSYRDATLYSICLTESLLATQVCGVLLGLSLSISCEGITENIRLNVSLGRFKH